jgi:aconitate hydratase
MANLVVGGLSYGQGSSREHAAMCPMYLGVRAVIARSFERIHAANLINFGILPLIFAAEADYQAIQLGDEILIPEVRRRLLAGEELVLVDQTRSRQIPLRHDMSDQDVQAVLGGGKLNLLRRKP